MSQMGTTNAEQAIFAGFPVEPVRSSRNATWRDRAQDLRDAAELFGGLVPVAAVPETLGISRPRVYQLISDHQLEAVEVWGVSYVSGRSIEQWEAASGELPGGKKVRRAPGYWDKVKIDAKTAVANLSAVGVI